MICPSCGVYLLLSDLVQRNATHMLGGPAIEYDARCPRCAEQIGHVKWGEFTPDERFHGKAAAPADAASGEESAQPAAAEGAQESPQPPANPESAQAAPPPVCPTCGRPWPGHEAPAT